MKKFGLLFILSLWVNFILAQDTAFFQNLPQPSLAEFLYKSGDLITHQDFPPIVSQYNVLQNKDKYLLIDIRKKDSYIAGHIDGAYNIPRDSVLWFLTERKNPAAYKKIVIICYTGQTASYTATLLRFYGIGNAFALKYGMAGWNKKFRNIIQKNLSAKYERNLDTTTYNKPPKGDLPQIAKQNAFDVLNKRVEELLKLPAKDFMVSADEVFENYNDYFIISYLPPAKYNIGHIPTAIRYNSRSDLSYGKDLATLPTDKKILVYCNIGQHSAAITAYLRLLGYDAYTLKFGLNSFMHNLAVKNLWFSDKGFLDLPIIEGNKRTQKVINTNNTTPEPQISIAPVPVNTSGNDEPSGGCE